MSPGLYRHVEGESHDVAFNHIVTGLVQGCQQLVTLGLDRLSALDRLSSCHPDCIVTWRDRVMMMREVDRDMDW